MASAVCARAYTCCTCSASARVSQSCTRSHLSTVPLTQRREKFSAGRCKITSRSTTTRRRSCGSVGVVRMGLRAVDSYDASFQLLPECEEKLLALLKSDSFCSQIGEQGNEDPDPVTYSFTGELFQPVPWSPSTKHGMPQEYEKYLEDKQQYLIINVPPNFMFQAKIFKPSRLCAVYRRVTINQ